VNNTLDNCPTNVLFGESLLDVTFIADPAAEVYDPVVYEGARAVVPDDVKALLAALCAGVTGASQSGVCQLAQQVAQNASGDGPHVGPTGQLPATMMNSPCPATIPIPSWPTTNWATSGRSAPCLQLASSCP
jgi:hypothetical protein